MNIDKAKVNKAVKKIKKMRAESEKKKKEPQKATFPYQVDSGREKTLMGIGIAMALAVLVGDKDKAKKKKKKSFFARTKSFYGVAGSILDSTVAQQLKIDSERSFKDDKLEALEIENAIKFDL